jgi:hypothetical protein
MASMFLLDTLPKIAWLAQQVLISPFHLTKIVVHGSVQIKPLVRCKATEFCGDELSVVATIAG